MEEKEKLNLEYELKKLPEEVNSYGESLIYLDLVIDESESLKLEILKTIKESRKVLFKEKLVNIFYNLIGEGIDLDYSFQEVDLLDQELNLCFDFITYQNILLGLINEDNYQEVTKLSDMTHSYLILNYNGLEDKLEANAYLSRGVNFRANNSEAISNQEEYRDFFNEKTAQIKPKVLKKV